MIDANDILKNLYAAYGTDSGILLGIPSDRMPSVKAIIDFTISQMNDKRSFPGDGEEFVRNRCRFGLCRIHPRCINEGLVAQRSARNSWFQTTASVDHSSSCLMIIRL